MSDTLSVPVDATLLETAAKAAYSASMDLRGPGVRVEPWISLPEYWKRIYRVQAAAVIEVVDLR